MTARPALAAGLLVVLAALPWALGPYAVLTVTAALALGLFALSFDLVLGVTGLVSVSHATLFGVGAYGMAIAMTRLEAPLWASLLVGVAAGAAMAWLIGFFSVRTAGPGFIIMTAIFAHAVEHIANVWTGLTGGENGIILDVHFAGGSVLGYYVVAASLAAAFAACRWLVGSRLGLILRGIKGNEVRALALGYRVGVYKVLVNVIAGALAAAAGMLYGLSQGFVSVDLLRVLLSIEVIVWTILGGPGTLLGPVLAAVLMSLGVDWLRSLTHQYLFAVGAVTLLVVLAAPDGIGALVGRRTRAAVPAQEARP